MFTVPGTFLGLLSILGHHEKLFCLIIDCVFRVSLSQPAKLPFRDEPMASLLILFCISARYRTRVSHRLGKH